jgi:hypothetical protein
MTRRDKYAWIVTLANVAIAAFVLVTLYAIISALAAFAAFVDAWPLLALLLIGVPLSITGLRLVRGLASRTWRYLGYLVNSTALAIHVILVVAAGALFVCSSEQRFVMTDGYKGDVYIFHAVSGGEAAEKTLFGVTYHIPQDGMLRTRSPLLSGLTRDEYYYTRRGGGLQRIQGLWPSTISRTPENLANDRDVGVYFPRSGTITDSAGCRVDYEMFYVGTRAYLLSKHQEKDVARYLNDHPVGCDSQRK